MYEKLLEKKMERLSYQEILQRTKLFLPLFPVIECIPFVNLFLLVALGLLRDISFKRQKSAKEMEVNYNTIITDNYTDKT